MKSPLQGLTRFFARPKLRIPAIALLLLTPVGCGLMPRAWAQSEAEGVEVLTRGPVHEAFAATINFKATEGVIAPQAPPETISEIPPEQRPEGDNVTWIPGYWAWDEESNGFLWVSGIWRHLPPGRQWIPGYWWESAQGHQWISGYWADAETDEVEYLSEPPASLEAGPNVAAPSRSHTWIPGTWRWRSSQYAWQPGYWNEVQPEWVWVPPYYSWAPQGWLYVDGYYDYDVPRRGLMFAPVRFSAGYAARPDSFYRPSTVISLTVFTNHLFLRPRNRHYYFGDYYAPEYRRSGYYASSNYYSGGYGYDPIYAHERWRHRDDDRWERRYEDNFAYYRDNESARPPHTLAALGAFLARPDRNRRVEADFATRLDQYSERRDAPVRLKKLGEAEQKTFAQRGREIRDFGDQRRNAGGRGAESADGKRGNDAAPNIRPKEGKPVKVKMPKSPVMAKAASGENSPPSRPNATASEEKSGGRNDRNPDRKDPGNQPDNKGRGTPRAEPVPDSPADPSDPRRGGRAGEPKEMPKTDRKDPPAREMPRVDPKDPVREMPKPEAGKPGNREAKPERDGQPQPREESRQPGSKSEPEPSPQRETKGKKDQAPQAEPKRASPDPVPVPKAEPTREPRAESKREPKPGPRAEPKREPKAEPTREPRSEPKREPQPAPRTEPKREPKPAPRAEPKREPKAEPKREVPQEPKREPKAEPKREVRPEPKREPKAEPRREAPSPRKEEKAAPRPQPKESSPAPQKPKKEDAQPGAEKEKKKGGKD